MCEPETTAADILAWTDGKASGRRSGMCGAGRAMWDVG